jgi:hypothetical protein
MNQQAAVSVGGKPMMVLATVVYDYFKPMYGKSE